MRKAAARRAAEPLYARALAIREKAFGPDSFEVAATLEDFAALLRMIDRQPDADAMSARAKAIRAREEGRSLMSSYPR
jgi:Tetratricopeptide repeat